MIRHDAALDLAAGAIDFRLTDTERHALDEHLAVCPGCAARAHAMRSDAAALVDLQVAALDPRRADAILARALTQPRRTAEPLRLVLVAALLALLAIASLAVGAEMLRRAEEERLAQVWPQPSQQVVPDPSAPAVPATPVPSATSEPSAAPSPSVAPPPGDSGAGTSWAPVTVPETELATPGGGSMSGVIAGGPGVIAWGQVYAAGPRIWTSTNGRSWQAATVEAPPDPDPEAKTPGIVASITRGGPGYVAVGFYDRLGTGRRAVVWTSTDGLAWSLVAHDPVLEHALMYRVLPWQGRLWAFGNAGIGAGGGATDSLAWSSADGVAWRSETLTLPAGKGMTLIDAAGDVLWGRLYALGDDLGTEPAVLATSADGRTWTPSPLPVPATGTLHVVDGELVALAVTGTASATTLGPGVYRSSDGITWETLVTGAATVGSDIIDAGGALVMVGTDARGDWSCATGCNAAGWRSIDGGKTWTLVSAGTGRASMQSVAALPDGTLVAVGQLIDKNGNSSLGAWVSPPAE